MERLIRADGRCYAFPEELLSRYEVPEERFDYPRKRYGDKPLDFGEDVRLRWVENSLQELPMGWRVLDVGAGPLRYKKYASHLNYVSQDFCQYHGTGTDSGIHPGEWDTSGIDIISDVCNIPEPDGSFDAVLCVSVLEHLSEPIRALKEFSRLLRPGEKLVLTAPFAGVTHLAPYYFYTGFPRYFYETHLIEDFVIDSIDSNGSLFEFLNTFFHYILSFAEKYTSEKPTTSEHFAIDQVTSMLERFASHETNSADLLNFGYQVLATRRTSSAS